MDTTLDRFKKQNVAYGFSADVMPSTLGPRRKLAAPANVAAPTYVTQPRTRQALGQLRAKNPRGGEPMVESFNRGTDPNSTVDLGTVTNDYMSGGDGTVARELGAPKQAVNIGGLPRDELIRRMENASTGMRGSPSARAAMMGMYADSVKAMDAGELQKNQGNIESDQQVYRGNMAANMQQAQGKQEFGNAVGLLNRKAGLDAAAAAASADPEMRQAKLDDLKSQTLTRNASALNASAETSATLPGKREKLWMDKQAALEKAGMPPDQARAQVIAEMAAGGNLDNSTSIGGQEMTLRSREAADTVNKGNFWLDQMLSGEDTHVWEDETINRDATNMNNFSLSSDVNGLAAIQNAVFNDGIRRLTGVDESGKKVNRLIKGDEVTRMEQIIADNERANKKRKLGE